MPRDGAIIFSDLIGYSLTYLIVDRGRDAKVIDWIDELTAECPKRIAHNVNDQCAVRCPVLPKVL